MQIELSRGSTSVAEHDSQTCTLLHLGLSYSVAAGCPLQALKAKKATPITGADVGEGSSYGMPV